MPDCFRSFIPPLMNSTASRFRHSVSVGAKAYRPHDPAKHEKLVSLARSGATHRQIAEVYGGTPHGVRSNLRRLRERGAL